MNKQEAENFFKKIYTETGSSIDATHWWEHSHNVAIVAETLGEKLNLDSEKCYVMGLLHDIGGGLAGKQKIIRHTILGYKIMKENNIDEKIARIAITHLFILQDGSHLKQQYINFEKNEQEFIENYLKNIEYTDYDKLIQISDLISGREITTIELRLFNVFSRHNIIENVKFVSKIKELKEYFESKIGGSIYKPFKDIIKMY